MPIQIVGAGMGRTGTKSLRSALIRLGFGPCHHMHEISDNPSLLAPWTAILNGERPDWHRIFAAYKATVDWPSAAYWRELSHTFPEAKVILTIRDPDEWHYSMMRTIAVVLRSETVQKDPYQSARIDMLRRLVIEPIFGASLEDRAHATAVYRRHNETVQEHVPADRLLVFDVKDGWHPLCAFLDVPKPDCAFPNENSAVDFAARNKLDQSSKHA